MRLQSTCQAGHDLVVSVDANLEQAPGLLVTCLMPACPMYGQQQYLLRQAMQPVEPNPLVWGLVAAGIGALVAGPRGAVIGLAAGAGGALARTASLRQGETRRPGALDA